MLIATAFTFVGAVAAALAFRFTRQGELNFGGNLMVTLTRGLVGVCVLLGFVSLGFYLEGFESWGGGKNPWWASVIFWFHGCLIAYTLLEKKLRLN